MNLKSIRELVRLLEHSDLTVLEVSEADTKIHLEKNPAPQRAQGLPVQKFPQPEAPAAKAPDGAVDFNNIVEIKSPMVGVYYSAPAPDAKPFVTVGSKVKKGDVLCVIEAMKLMNEITAEVDGEIVDVCVENGQVVEYAQILFKVF
ncbi:MAG TPA: acetyl-CoA carboxylase biotin carboxyl carrier protein [Feifaniaceae bacterium]|nr:acetyl-CoA carboxylase biotin carboxyl carrier protein [Feifaniaceae bacterium]